LDHRSFRVFRHSSQLLQQKVDFLIAVHGKDGQVIALREYIAMISSVSDCTRTQKINKTHVYGISHFIKKIYYHGMGKTCFVELLI
jgi:hypothetical protein